MSRILIAGCGYVGTSLAGRLAAQSHEVWALRRRPELMAEGIHSISADLTEVATLTDLPPELDYVFYTAAATGRNDEAYRAAYVDGVRNLLDALAVQSSLKRVFLTSSTGVYAQRDGTWVDEESPTAPTHFTGLRMLEAERLLLAGPLPATIVRLGGIYGPGRTRVIEQVRRGEAQCAPVPRYVNRIHRDDAAAALEHLMRHPEPERIYLGVDHEPADMTMVLRWLAGMMGAAAPGVAASPKCEPAEVPSNKRCRNAKLVASGYTFTYPTFRDGYAAMLAEDAHGPTAG